MECTGRNVYPPTQTDGTHAPTQHKLNTVPDYYNWNKCRDEQNN